MKKKIFGTLYFLFILVFCGGFSMAQTFEDYPKLFKDRVEIGKAGSSITAVFVDEKGARFVNFGTVGKDSASPAANEKTIYEIGSNTKLFVGVLLADAVKRGEVKLDAPISDYLPKTVKTPKFNGKEITLLDLATHTSSLPRLPENFNPKDALNPYFDYTSKNLYDFLSDYKLTREIGSQYEYSNLGIGLLGHILSLRAKMSFDKLITTRIFKPLQMNETSLALPDTKKSLHAQGLNAANEPTPLWFFDALAGAGAIRSTTEDMAKFIAASVGIKQTPLFDSFVEARKMLRQGEYKHTQIGLCWNNVKIFDTEIFWHGGGTYGFSSFLAIDPKAKKGAFLANNSGQETGGVFLQDVAFNFLQPKFAVRKTKPGKAEITLSEDVLEKYVGEYQLAPTFSIVVTREGTRLFIQATGQDKFEAFAEKEDVFFLKVVEASITFTKDSGGKTVSLILNQGGQNIPGKKIK